MNIIQMLMRVSFIVYISLILFRLYYPLAYHVFYYYYLATNISHTLFDKICKIIKRTPHIRDLSLICILIIFLACNIDDECIKTYIMNEVYLDYLNLTCNEITHVGARLIRDNYSLFYGASIGLNPIGDEGLRMLIPSTNILFEDNELSLHCIL